MLKMLMDPMGGIVLTNDGNAILREITVQHPSAKTMIEIARSQDEEVGDGTTSVVILTGEVLYAAEPFLTIHSIHPLTIIRGYQMALTDILDLVHKKFCIELDPSDEQRIEKVVNRCVGTKLLGVWTDLACRLALGAVKTVLIESNGRKDIDIKYYARVEKIPGGRLEDSQLLDGIMINKDVTHPAMRRLIQNPRIILLDCPLEYKKGESQTSIEIMNETDFAKILMMEEEYVKKICSEIIAFKPDLVISEKGISDLAQHYLQRAGITAIRRVRKTDNNRIARACGATIVNRTEDLKETDVGTGAGLFEIKKIGDEYYTFITKCTNPKACTILLRAPTKDILNEAERNLHDAMCVARNIMLEPKLLLGGGCVEMLLVNDLLEKSNSVPVQYQEAYRAAVNSLLVIPRTLIQNTGAPIIQRLTELRKAIIEGNVSTGINGITGELIDVLKYEIYDPLVVKQQIYKTAIEVF
ncbi:hypothetical protein AAG570_007597 [Ranatra chinensis]|uniref:T-complex protein 1 subunit gamma n=1 Tax=Ranatra chinensis TaxID=642074 RepID=A0ABD0XU81_9HEMI